MFSSMGLSMYTTSLVNSMEQKTQESIVKMMFKNSISKYIDGHD
jgi:hypothetical protein